MNAPIHKSTKEERKIFNEILTKLIINLSKLGGSDIVIPFVDNSKIVNEEDKLIVVEFLNSLENICHDYKVNLA